MQNQVVVLKGYPYKNRMINPDYFQVALNKKTEISLSFLCALKEVLAAALGFEPR